MQNTDSRKNNNDLLQRYRDFINSWVSRNTKYVLSPQASDNIKNKFSINDLKIKNPEFANELIIPINQWPFKEDVEYKLHLGCGSKILDNFVNIDLLPQTPDVLKWNLLYPWPMDTQGKVSKIFSEDVMEHFYKTEQCYILCSANVALKENGIFRILMPNIDRLIEYMTKFDASNTEDWYVKNFGVRTAADMLNSGMRFWGHKWLHNDESLSLLAHECGFNKIKTTCSNSTDNDLNNLNIRDEIHFMSYANDLIKERDLKYLRISPNEINNATLIEQVNDTQGIYKSTTDDAQLIYPLPIPVLSAQIVCINYFGLNFSHFLHSNTELFFDGIPNTSIVLDDALKSNIHGNIFTFSEIRRLQFNEKISYIRIDPSRSANEYFLAGPLEIFYFN